MIDSSARREAITQHIIKVACVRSTDLGWQCIPVACNSTPQKTKIERNQQPQTLARRFYAVRTEAAEFLLAPTIWDHFRRDGIRTDSPPWSYSLTCFIIQTHYCIKLTREAK
jgi:hypothetical protein